MPLAVSADMLQKRNDPHRRRASGKPTVHIPRKTGIQTQCIRRRAASKGQSAEALANKERTRGAISNNRVRICPVPFRALVRHSNPNATRTQPTQMPKLEMTLGGSRSCTIRRREATGKRIPSHAVSETTFPRASSARLGCELAAFGHRPRILACAAIGTSARGQPSRALPARGLVADSLGPKERKTASSERLRGSSPSASLEPQSSLQIKAAAGAWPNSRNASKTCYSLFSYTKSQRATNN